MKVLAGFIAPVSSDSELEQCLTQNRLAWETYPSAIFLKPNPNKRSILPLLDGSLNFSKAWPEVRLRLGLFELQASGELKSNGFRYETPEGPDVPGAHNYYHQQPIANFVDYQLSQDPVCESVPAAPLDASSPIALVLSLLLSLYGSEGIERLSKDVQNLIRREIQSLRAIKYRTQFLMASTAQGSLYFSVRGPNPEQQVKNATGGASVESCTEAEYRGASESQRRYLARDD